jgi:hypothetical protein
LANFDNNNFNVQGGRSENPWDTNFGAGTGVDALPPPERTVSPLVRILAIILLAALLIYFLYTIIVHPVDRLKLRLMLAKHCVIEIKVRDYWGGGDSSKILIIYIDQEIFAMGDGYPNTRNLKYYKLIDDVLYEYSEEAGEWYESYNNNGDSDIFTEDMFVRKNYQWADGHLFAWRYKGTDMILKCRFGKFKFEIDYSGYDVTIEFKKISPWHLSTPFEE